MPPIEQLTDHSLREFGLGGTLLVLVAVFLIVYMWKRPPRPEHASPIQSVDEKAKLIPMILEEVRDLGRDMRRGLANQEEIMERLERVETTNQIIKDRQRRE